MCNNSAFISLRAIIVSIVTSAFVQHTHSAAGNESTIVHILVLSFTQAQTLESWVKFLSIFQFHIYSYRLQAVVFECLHLPRFHRWKSEWVLLSAQFKRSVNILLLSQKPAVQLNEQRLFSSFSLFALNAFSLPKIPRRVKIIEFSNPTRCDAMRMSKAYFPPAKISVYCCFSTCNDVRLAAQHHPLLSKGDRIVRKITKHKRKFLAILSSLMCVAITVIVCFFPVVFVFRRVLAY